MPYAAVPQVGRVIPIKRWPVLQTGRSDRRLEVLSVVERCGTGKS